MERAHRLILLAVYIQKSFHINKKLFVKDKEGVLIQSLLNNKRIETPMKRKHYFGK